MKYTLVLFLFAFCVCFTTHAQVGTSDKQKNGLPQAVQEETIADTPDIIEARRLSAEIVNLFRAGKYDEAFPLAERAVRLREFALNPEHHLVAAALNNLMLVQIERGKLSEAKKIGERSLKILEKSFGVDDDRLITVLNAIARIEIQNRDYVAVESALNRILAIRQIGAGAESLETAEAMLTLARFYQARGDSNDKAEKLYRQTLALQEKAFGQNDKRIAATLENYAALLFLLNRTEEALQVEERSIRISGIGQTTPHSTPLSGGVLNGKALSKPAPYYPTVAKRQRVQGTVEVEILVNEVGRVTDARAISGPQMLREVSEMAALKTRFSPTLLQGFPIKVTGRVTYNFRVE